MDGDTLLSAAAEFHGFSLPTGKDGTIFNDIKVRRKV